MGMIGDFIRARKALKMGKDPVAAANGNKTSAESAYDAKNFFQKPTDGDIAANPNNPYWRDGRTTSPFSRG